MQINFVDFVCVSKKMFWFWLGVGVKNIF